MILLSSADTLQFFLGGATTTTPGVLYAAFADIADDGSTFAPGKASAPTTGATDVTLLGSPASDTFRQVKYLSVYNADSVNMTVTVQVTDAGTDRVLIVKTLSPGQRLEYVDGHGFSVNASASSASGRSGVSAVSSSSGVVTLDYALGDYFTLTLTENVTGWVIDNPPGSGQGFSIMVEITQGASAYTVANPGTSPGGAIAVSAGSGDVDALAISSFDNGATLRCNLANDYS